MTGLPSVSVVMPARDAAATVDRAVTSVMEQEYDGDLELIVADGNSSDRTIAILAAAASQNPRVTVVPNPAATTPAGLNAAIAEASGDVIVRCDAHCVLPPGYIATAVGDLAETGADVVGGIQNPRGETLGQKATAAAMRSWLGSGGAAYRLADRAGPTDTVYLGIFKRSALDRVGGFDESLVRNQDYELNYRIRSTGALFGSTPTSGSPIGRGPHYGHCGLSTSPTGDGSVGFSECIRVRRGRVSSSRRRSSLRWPRRPGWQLQAELLRHSSRLPPTPPRLPLFRWQQRSATGICRPC